MEVIKEMMGPLGMILGALLVLFVVVAIVLRKVLLSDTMTAIKRMKSAETNLAKKEESMQTKLDANEQELTRKQAEAEEELHRQRESSEQDLSRMKERLKAEATAEADKIISEAQLNKDKLREQLERELAGQAVEYAGQLFKLVIGKEVNEKLNEAFVAELIGALEEVDGASIHVEADEAEFIASHPLNPDQRVKLEQLLKEKFDVDMKIEEKVDENLLGGLMIKLGSLEIDGSILNRYQEGVNQIKKTV